MIFSANQWTGFYMIGTSVMKELINLFTMLSYKKISHKPLQLTEAYSEPSPTFKMELFVKTFNS